MLDKQVASGRVQMRKSQRVAVDQVIGKVPFGDFCAVIFFTLPLAGVWGQRREAVLRRARRATKQKGGSLFRDSLVVRQTTAGELMFDTFSGVAAL
jgi:hypothetical protein